MIVLNGPKGATFLFVSQGACGIAGVVRVNDIVELDARLSAKILLFVCRTQARGPALIIDIFNHFMPRPYLDRIAKLIPDHVAVTAFPRLDTLVDVDARLRLVESFDGLRQVLSLANPPLEAIGPPAVAAELARIANDCLAEICGKYPHAFPTFIAALPLNDVDASITEMDRAIGSLGARGVQLFTNVAGKPLSAPEFRPIFRRMAEHDLPVWIHPMRGPNFPDYVSEKASEDEIWFSFGWPYETTACMARLIYSGLFGELPELKIISHHMGGMIPYFPAKIKLGFRQIFYGTIERNPAAERRDLKKPRSIISRCSMPTPRSAVNRRRRGVAMPSLVQHIVYLPRTRHSIPSRAGH